MKRHPLLMKSATNLLGNLRAGLKASIVAAFDAATGFFQTGHSLLGHQGWETDPGIMLKLCSSVLDHRLLIEIQKG